MKDLLLTLSIVTVILTFFLFHICTDPGEGEKIGTIVKLSKQGLFKKTWEGELIRGGFLDGSGTIGGSFHFTIESDELARKALELMKSKKEVVLFYEIEFLSLVTRSESGNPHFAVSILENNQ